MAELRTEEEQVEAIKSWWKENGRSLLIGIVVAVAAVVGWKGWQQKVETESANASIRYQNLVESMLALQASPDAEDQRATAQHLADTIREEHGDTGYASMAALLVARAAVDAGELEQALQELDWVVENGSSEELKQLALLRSARIQLARGEQQQAESLLAKTTDSYFPSLVNELKGDLFVAKGYKAQAHEAYVRALETASQQGRPILEMKRDNVVPGASS
ncbi:YfgM family protein [Marinobacterium litorale]|uniref:YfgM family protein n=1 Tax=Marinobacterium litorale TaxID=404770 RepID=UPI000416B20D|nr:tetratricopeptide repeat protein [Marinobacterium litorale]